VSPTASTIHCVATSPLAANSRRKLTRYVKLASRRSYVGFTNDPEFGARERAGFDHILDLFMRPKLRCYDAGHKCDAILVQFFDEFIVRGTLRLVGRLSNSSEVLKPLVGADTA
jgi:hypothetical protein